MSLTKRNRGPLALWVVLSILVFFNPNIGVVDLLPDCIGAFLLALILKDAADLSPYFSEARSALLKLGFCDLCKFFAPFVIFGRSNTVGQGDMSAMLSLTFLVLDTVFALIAVKYLFDGLFYLGERSDARALYAPFPVLGNAFDLDPERLKSFTCVFLVARNVLSTLPEFLRLSRDPISTDGVDLSVHYPRLLLFSVIIVGIGGLVWLFLTLRYYRAIRKEGRAHDALRDRLSAEELAIYEEKVMHRTLRTGAWLFIVATVFLLTFRLDSYGGLNILPSFLFPLLSLIAFHILSSYLPVAKGARALAAAATISSIGVYVTQAIFFESYTFIDLLNSPEALSLYHTYEWLCVFDAALTLGMLAYTAAIAFSFIRRYTTEDKELSERSRVDLDFERTLRRHTVTALSLCALSVIARMADVFFKGRVTVIFPNPDNAFSPSTIVTGALPWFSTVCAALAVLSVLTVFILYTRLREAFLVRYPDPEGDDRS